jgi:protein subunit release factor B
MGRELLFSLTKKDFIVQTFRSGGKGGQNQNVRNTGVRIIHPESGARGESREHRTYEQNKRAAFKRMVETVKFKIWYQKTCYELRNKKSITESVSEAMQEENLRVEIKENGRWVPWE